MRIFFSWLMTFVFAFEPFLQAQAADKQNADALIQQIKASSLGVKGKTYGDLYMFMKMNVPSRFTDRFAQLLLSRRHEALPNIEFSKFKTKEGHEGVKMILSDKGLSHTVEILNEDAMFAKIDGTPLTWRDVDSVTPALNKVVARNPNLYDRVASTGVFKPNPTVAFNPRSTNSVFGGNFVIPFKENWDRWTPKQRARFVMEIRKTWQASLAVERYLPNTGAVSRKSASILHPFFLNALAIEEAFAAGGTKNECKSPLPPMNQECIHSGFVGLVTKNGGSLNCSHPSELTEAQLKAYPKIAAQKIPTDCKANGQRACNTAIYGYQREGAKNQTICVSVNAKAKIGQDVTHWQGACEIASPLDSTAEAKKKGISAMESWLAKIDIDPGNVTKEVKDQIRKGFEESSVALDNAAAQLASALNLDAKDMRNKHFYLDGSPEKANVLQTITTFYTDINEKLAVCTNMYKDGKKSVIDRNPKNKNCDFSQQLGACQQLFRRKLVMDTLVSGLCPNQVFQQAPPDKDKPRSQIIWGQYDDAKLETIQPGSLDPAKTCWTPAAGDLAEPPKPAPVATTPKPAPEMKCELGAPSKKYTLKVEGDKCLCVHNEDPKKIESAIPDLDSGGAKYRCPEEKDSSINPLIPLGIAGAGLLLYALNRDKSKSGQCPANTTRVGDNCYFNASCDKTKYPDVTMINDKCVLPGTCPEGTVASADGTKCVKPSECEPGTTLSTDGKSCVYPSVCPTGTTKSADGKTCVAACPANTKLLPNGTCQWGVACPMLGGQIVYDLSQCSEGNGTTQPIPGAGGVQ